MRSSRSGCSPADVAGTDGFDSPRPLCFLPCPAMKTPGPVVVGTDLSTPADEALRQGAAWAERTGAPLVVAHVAPPAVFQQVKTESVRNALGERVATAAPDSQANILLEPGTAHARLIELCSDRAASLLAVGSSGHGLTARLLGSTAEQVTRYAGCPVLVARPSPEGGPVLAATDLSDLAAPAIRAGGDEARRRGAPLELLHSLYEPPSPLSAIEPLIVSGPAPTAAERDAERNAATQTLRSLLEAYADGGDVVVVDGPPGQAIVERARDIGTALVVVATHGRTGLSRAALGSVAEHVVQHAPCSVLVTRLHTES